MIEAGQVGPRLQRMARFTTSRAPIRTALRHALAKFAMMRVGVASRAAPVLEAIGSHLCRIARLAGHMALRTRYRQMCSDEPESGLLMLRDRIRRGLESGDHVALLTLILVRRA